MEEHPFFSILVPTDEARFLGSNNPAFSSDRFRELGGFDASFMTSEDREFCDRWLYTDHA